MTRQTSFHIAVFAGDGIGVEVMAECLTLLRHLSSRDSRLMLNFEMLKGGAAHYAETGSALSEDTLARAAGADAILFGAMGLPHIRHPDGREIAPQLDLREQLDLYAGVRPVRSIPGLPAVLADSRSAAVDFVLIRESTEGLFARRTDPLIDAESVTDVLRVSERATRRVSEFAFKLAARRASRGRALVTCIDKANVLASMAYFRKTFDEVAVGRAPLVDFDHMYVDAAALNLVRRPWDFDVMVTENMFGDILSDLGAALLGGMGLAPSADVGDDHALFQPCHGSAPDIIGTGKANPIGMFLSAAMMLDWLADRGDNPACGAAANHIRAAVDTVFVKKAVLPFELGGTDPTARVTAAVIAAIDFVQN